MRVLDLFSGIGGFGLGLERAGMQTIVHFLVILQFIGVIKMNEIEFKVFEKIPRVNPFTVTVTEKIDGTNACIVIKDAEIVGVQSRKRFITPESDNYGFASWVEDNKTELLTLGEGYHYGEWAGLGIQKNPLNLHKKRFFLFNTFRWNKNNPNRPECCDVVPVLYQGELKPVTIPGLLESMKVGDVTREGVVVYYHAFRKYTKHTIKSPDGKWCAYYNDKVHLTQGESKMCADKPTTIYIAK